MKQPQVLCEGEHPIHLYATDDPSVEPHFTHANEPEDTGKPSRQSHDKPPSSSKPVNQISNPLCNGQETGSLSSPAVLPVVRQLHSTARLQGRNTVVVRHNRGLRVDITSNGDISGTDHESDEDPESCEKKASEVASSSSSQSSDSESERSVAELQFAQAGQQFEDEDGHTANIGEDSDIDLDAVKLPASKATEAAVAPFRDGGLPNIPRTSAMVGELSEITDFGELIYAKSGKQRVRKASSSTPSRRGERRSAKKTLQQQLFSALHLTSEGKKDFFPRSVLPIIIDEQRVREELGRHLDLDVHKKKAIANYAKQICEETEFEDKDGIRKIRCFRKIFAILVMIQKTPAIIKFLERDVNDSDLPLEKVERQHDQGAYDLRLSRYPDKRLRCFSKQWNQLHIRNFEELQWRTLTPFFGRGGHKDVMHYRLQDQAILPFIEVTNRKAHKSLGRTLEFEGGFGRVFKVDIHPDHHNFDSVNMSPNNNSSFAVKCLHSPDRVKFKQEVEMLKKFSNPSHEHLISLLATYEQFGSYFLVFHWAESDLRRYWIEVNNRPTMDRETILWVAKQCKGITDGVLAIHKYTSSNSRLNIQPLDQAFGHHGDIKPENVLWFPDSDVTQTNRGTLKLSDFGLAEFSLHRTVSMQVKPSFATSPSYRAPDIDLEGTGAIGRAYDMWTLGCLYLELITWLIGGWDLVNLFIFQRMEADPMMSGRLTSTFFRLVEVDSPDGRVKHSAVIKPIVTQFIDELSVNESCTDFLREFLGVVKNELLLIKTRDDNEKRGRSTCQEIAARLSKMLRKCNSDDRYLLNNRSVNEQRRQSRRYLWTDNINLHGARTSSVTAFGEKCI